MKILTDIDTLKLHNSIVTLGKFDGNHIGHQRLFDTAVSLKQDGDLVVIFTFSVPPAAVIGQEEKNEIRTIQTHGERQQQIYPEGVDVVVEFPFNEKTRNMSPEDFVKEILVDKLDVKMIVVGVDFRFGKDRAGNVEMLQRLGEHYGFNVVPVEKVRYQISGEEKEQEVSSTLIKQEILKGNMEDVHEMLGCPFSITGKVLYGKQYGRTIGFPTINLAAPDDKILPPNGVYATKVCFDERILPSITNVGIRPTFDDGEDRTVETHILAFHEDIYGKTVRVDFYKYIRPERKFSSGTELMEEIQKNVQTVRTYFKECPDTDKKGTD